MNEMAWFEIGRSSTACYVGKLRCIWTTGSFFQQFILPATEASIVGGNRNEQVRRRVYSEKRLVFLVFVLRRPR